MAASSIGPCLDALVVKLALRAGLAGVNLYTAPVAPEQLGNRAIEFGDTTEAEQTWAEMGSRKISESYSLRGSISITQPMTRGVSRPATINAAAKKARDAALLVYEEIRDELAADPTLGSVVDEAALDGFTMEQGFAPEGQIGRVCTIEFLIAVDAEVTV